MNFAFFLVPPIIHVPNQLVGAPLGTDVDLECFVEASPKAINYWVKETGKNDTNYKKIVNRYFTLYCKSFVHISPDSTIFFRCSSEQNLKVIIYLFM